MTCEKIKIKDDGPSKQFFIFIYFLFLFSCFNHVWDLLQVGDKVYLDEASYALKPAFHSSFNSLTNSCTNTSMSFGKHLVDTILVSFFSCHDEKHIYRHSNLKKLNYFTDTIYIRVTKLNWDLHAHQTQNYEIISLLQLIYIYINKPYNFIFSYSSDTYGFMLFFSLSTFYVLCCFSRRKMSFQKHYCGRRILFLLHGAFWN